MHVIDRRQNPKSKSLGNRGRFVRRVKSHIRKAVGEAIRNRKVADLDSSEKVSVSSSDVSEPNFHFQPGTGDREFVLPGNQSYQRGDRIRKPRSGAGGIGASGSADGEGEDSFVFMLSREEFLELFFEDLELPNLAKKKLKSLASSVRTRAGFASDGAPQRLNLKQTMRRSLSRRIALRRPKQIELQSLLDQIEQARTDQNEAEIQRLADEIELMKRRMRSVAYLDTVDLRYNRFDVTPKPTTQAVMFCLMDTSASMTEDLKELAKRFYMLLHLFLVRHYQAVELVFIRHTYTASEVDEDTFFHGRETGGTIVSSALEEMATIVKNRYPVADWNIYAAQASDGHNFDHDMPRTLTLLEKTILPICQYYAYIEVNGEVTSGESLLWDEYSSLVDRYPHFARAQVSEPSAIYPVFRKLFAAT
ncbi:YeaH/YhbH family protein [Rubripirellula tenax]|nr:YeaH/YhbH family protein [Rubripirellula tenax]